MRHLTSLVLVAAFAAFSGTANAEVVNPASDISTQLAEAASACLSAHHGGKFQKKYLINSGWSDISFIGIFTVSKADITMFVSPKSKQSSGCVILRSVSSEEYLKTVEKISKVTGVDARKMNSDYTWGVVENVIQLSPVQFEDGIQAKLIVSVPIGRRK